MPLSPALRKFLDGVDKSDLMEITDLNDLQYHVQRLRKTYPLSDESLARLLLELTSGCSEALASLEGVTREDGAELTVEDVKLAVQNWISSQAVLAAALTRVKRGRPPLWQ